MGYKLLADTVLFVHLLWILFLIFGVFWGMKNKKVKRIHITGLTFALIIQAFNWYCPLTYLETWLRSKHDPTLSYTGSFISHYAEKIVYIELPPSLIFGMTTLLAGITSWLYVRRKRQI
ncbi:MAG TPA: DUF2784 domain-containing protein [Thermodesulfovibrionales bacterium]|jgi:TRAP-type uncharacterized transport system fused permease subunit|nr:DUF2784 domain-containing protein [Thermodesulfovibrionales bacterium]